MEKSTDIVGREIKAGCLVAYAVRSGNSGELRLGIIKKVTQQPKRWGEGTESVFVVRGVDKYSSKPKLNTKDGKLLYSNRIVVLDSIKEPYQTILKEHIN